MRESVWREKAFEWDLTEECQEERENGERDQSIKRKFKNI